MAIPGQNQLAAAGLNRLQANMAARRQQAELAQQWKDKVAIDPTKLGEDPFSKMIRGRAQTIGDKLALPTSEAEYFKGLSGALQGSPAPYYGANFADPITNASYQWRYNAAPVSYLSAGDKGYYYVPSEVMHKMTKSGQYLPQLFGNEELFKRGKLGYLPEDVAKQVATTDFLGSQYDISKPGLGYFFTPEDWGAAVDLSGGWRGESFSGDVAKPFAGQNLMRLTPELRSQLAGAYGGAEDRGGMADRAAKIGAGEWVIPDPSNPNNILVYDRDTGKATTHNVNTWTEKRGGGGFLGGLMNIAAPILSFTVPGFGAGYSLGQGLVTGNPMSIISGALGTAGAFGYNPLGDATKAIGSALPSGTPDWVAPAVTQGGLGGLTAAFTGGDVFKNILGGATQGGLGQYLAGKDILGGQGSALNTAAQKGLAGLGASLVTGAPLGAALTKGAAGLLGGGALDATQNKYLAGLAQGVAQSALQGRPQPRQLPQLSAPQLRAPTARPVAGAPTQQQQLPNTNRYASMSPNQRAALARVVAGQMTPQQRTAAYNQYTAGRT